MGQYNIILVSVAFAILFSGFNPLQNYATTLFPDGVGNESLAVLYATVAVTVFLGPPMVDALGTRLTLFIGAACYVAYMLTLIHFIKEVVLSFSVVIGFGAAVLWVALGVFIAQNSTPDKYASNTGLFWGIFQVNNIAGNLCAYFVFQQYTTSNAAPIYLYVFFAVMGAVGTALLLGLRAPSIDARDAGVKLDGIAAQHNDDDDAPETMHTWESRWSDALASAFAALCLLFTLDTALLSTMYLFSGLELSFWTGEFTQLLPGNVIGLVMTFAGVGEVVGGLAMGRLSDVAGRSATITLASVLYGGGLAIASVMHHNGLDACGPKVAGAPVIAYIAALLFGLGDAGFNTCCYAICAQLYDVRGPSPRRISGDEISDGAAAKLLARDDGGEVHVGDVASATAPRKRRDAASTASVGGYTIFQLLQNIGSAIWFEVSLHLPLHDSPGVPGTYAQVYVQAVLLLVGTLAFIAVDVRHRRKAPGSALQK